MAKTISTHNGSAAHRAHNIRAPWATDSQEHIDKSLRGRNEILHDEQPREAYRRIFGDALEAYNAKQSRPERQIQDYYTHIDQHAKKHPVYEMIVQIGDRNDTGIDAPVERQCLKEFYAGWAERNPHLECIGAYLHADESDGTLHMHIDYVPVATGYKRGMETQSSLSKALEQQGFVKDGKLTGQIQWEARENAALEAICNRHGIEIYHPMSEKREHLTTTQYKAWQSTQQAYETKEQLEQAIDEHQEALGAVQQELDAAKEERDEVLQESREIAQKGAEAMRKVKDIQAVIPTLENKKEALESDVASLEATIDSMKSRYEEVQNDLEDAEEELEATEQAIKEKRSEGKGLFRSHDEMQHMIQQKREAVRAEKKDNLLARFAQFLIREFPSVKKLWEQFQAEHGRTGHKKKQKDISD